MTTLIGIAGYNKTEPRSQSIVLASDIATTQQNWEASGDVAHMQRTRKESQKIHINDAGDAAIAMSGVRDDAYKRFLYDFLKGKIDFRKSIEKEFFEELLRMNLDRFEGKMFNGEMVNGLLIATRYDNQPKLWYCWPLGKLDRKIITAMGSGSEYALKHISTKDILSPEQITVGNAIQYASEAVEAASTDIYTTGLDLVVVAPDKITTFGNRLKSDIDRAKRSALDSIAENS